MADRCRWIFHGISRTWEDGKTTLAMYGWNYTSNAERRSGALPVETAETPCAVRVVESDGERTESGPAMEMTREHCGEHCTPVWQGRGWTVEFATGYRLWSVQG
jgi:hypothetical protein